MLMTETQKKLNKLNLTHGLMLNAVYQHRSREKTRYIITTENKFAHAL